MVTLSASEDAGTLSRAEASALSGTDTRFCGPNEEPNEGSDAAFMVKPTRRRREGAQKYVRPESPQVLQMPVLQASWMDLVPRLR